MSDETILLPPPVKMSELSTEAHYAFNAVLAMLGGPTSMAAKRFVKADSLLTMAAAAKKQIYKKGLNELMEKGVVECERDGLGEWVPTVLHLERLENDSRLVLSS